MKRYKELLPVVTRRSVALFGLSSVVMLTPPARHLASITPTSEPRKPETAEDIIGDIFARHGIFIPNETDKSHAVSASFIRNAFGIDTFSEEALPTNLSVEEAGMVHSVLDKIPGAGTYTDSITILREPQNSAAAQRAAVRGYSYESQVFIMLSANFSVNSPYFHADASSIQTEGELLSYVITHELGHNFSSAVAQVVERETDQKVTVENIPVLVGDKEIGPFVFTSRDDIDPLYGTYGAVTKWEYDRGGILYYEDKIIDASGFPFFWFPNPPRPRDRERFPNVNSEHSIEEALADDFANYALRPEILPPLVRAYFARIFYGLQEDPSLFIQNVADNPMVLLEGIKT